MAPTELVLEGTSIADSAKLIERVRASDVPRTVARALSTHPDASQILLDAALDPRGNDKLIWPHCDGLFWLHPRDCPPNGVSGLTRRQLSAGRLVTDDRDNHGHERDAQGREEEDVVVDGVSP